MRKNIFEEAATCLDLYLEDTGQTSYGDKSMGSMAPIPIELDSFDQKEWDEFWESRDDLSFDEGAKLVKLAIIRIQDWYKSQGQQGRLPKGPLGDWFDLCRFSRERMPSETEESASALREWLRNPDTYGLQPKPASSMNLTEIKAACGVRNMELMERKLNPAERLATLREEFPELRLDPHKLRNIYKTHKNRLNNERNKKS